LAIVIVIADLRRRNLKMLEQLSGVASVFGGDRVHRLQNSHCPEGHILQVADWGSYYIQSAMHVGIVAHSESEKE
jgi:hypothetical protein